MRKFLLALSLGASTVVVVTSGVAGVLSLGRINHNWNVLGCLLLFCLSFSYILALAIEGLLRE